MVDGQYRAGEPNEINFTGVDMRTHASPREREEREAKNQREASLYQWLRDGVLGRQAITFEQARAIFYRIRATREVLIIDSRQHAGGRPLHYPDGSKADEDQSAYSITSPPFPHFSIASYDTIKEAHDKAIELGLKPTVHVYDLPEKKH
jgi:hypothetical protein